jgi:hypothetical protein
MLETIGRATSFAVLLVVGACASQDPGPMPTGQGQGGLRIQLATPEHVVGDFVNDSTWRGAATTWRCAWPRAPARTSS